MKKAMLLAALIAVVAVPSAFADWRVDIGADVLIYAGIGGTPLGDDMGAFAQYIIPFPNGTISYSFDLGVISLGVGAKLYTFILINIVSPVVYAELDLSPVVVNLSVWGGGFLIFGLANGFYSQPILIPDLSAMFKIGKTMRIGPGIMFPVFLSEDVDAFPYVIYAAVKFNFPI